MYIEKKKSLKMNIKKERKFLWLREKKAKFIDKKKGTDSCINGWLNRIICCCCYFFVYYS